MAAKIDEASRSERIDPAIWVVEQPKSPDRRAHETISVECPAGGRRDAARENPPPPRSELAEGDPRSPHPVRSSPKKGIGTKNGRSSQKKGSFGTKKRSELAEEGDPRRDLGGDTR